MLDRMSKLLFPLQGQFVMIYIAKKDNIFICDILHEKLHYIA